MKETENEKLLLALSKIELAIKKVSGEMQIKREFPEREIASMGNFKPDIEQRRHQESLNAIKHQNKILKYSLIASAIGQLVVITLQIFVIFKNLL